MKNGEETKFMNPIDNRQDSSPFEWMGKKSLHMSKSGQ